MNKFKTQLYFIVALLFLLTGNAFATPDLQLYIENGKYDDTESWVSYSPDFKLWVLGSAESDDNLNDILLSYAFDSNETGSVTFSPTTTSLVRDHSTPDNPEYLSKGTGSPLGDDESELSSRDIYDKETNWVIMALGDFDLKDSRIGDFEDETCFGRDCEWDKGQVNVYDVNISGYSWVYFDAFDDLFDVEVTSENHVRYSNIFSDDGDNEIDNGTGVHIPEPNMWWIILIFGILILSLVFFRTIPVKKE